MILAGPATSCSAPGSSRRDRQGSTRHFAPRQVTIGQVKAGESRRNWPDLAVFSRAKARPDMPGLARQDCSGLVARCRYRAGRVMPHRVQTSGDGSSLIISCQPSQAAPRRVMSWQPSLEVSGRVEWCHVTASQTGHAEPGLVASCPASPGKSGIDESIRASSYQVRRVQSERGKLCPALSSRAASGEPRRVTSCPVQSGQGRRDMQSHALWSRGLPRHLEPAKPSSAESDPVPTRLVWAGQTSPVKAGPIWSSPDSSRQPSHFCPRPDLSSRAMPGMPGLIERRRVESRRFMADGASPADSLSGQGSSSPASRAKSHCVRFCLQPALPRHACLA